jgi:RND family efflux transporter MFP subunit
MAHLVPRSEEKMLLEKSFVRRVRNLYGVLLILLPAGCSRNIAEPEKTPPAPVKWMEARQFFIEEWTEIIGTTQPLPDRAARVSAAVEGRVLSVLQGVDGKLVSEGQLVKKGDVLVRLDDRIARAGRDKTEADQKELEQQVEGARLGVDLAAIEVRKLEELSRKSVPGSQPLVAPVELDKARVTLDDAKSKLKGAELKVKAGEKQLKALDEQLKLYTLTAPIAGRLGRILVVQGQTLSVGTAVAEIIDIEDQIDLLCFVPPYIASKLKTNEQPVRIPVSEDKSRPQVPSTLVKESDSTSGKKPATPDGKIVYIADQSEIDTGNFAVKVRFRNAGRKLRSNLTVRALVRTTPGKACLTLRASALMEDVEPPAVIVVDDYKKEPAADGKETETGKARKLNARVGIRDRLLDLVEIISVDDPEKKWQGTLETAKFVFDKGLGLRTGDPIKLEEEEEEEAPAAPEKKE